MELIDDIKERFSEWNEGGKAIMIPMAIAEAVGAGTVFIGIPYGAFKIGEFVVLRVAELIP